MARTGTQLSPEVLIEEARFILRTLQREDLFGERVRLTEAERVIDTSISLSFADYCGFLNKYGYIRIDQLANMIEVTEGGALVAQDLDDSEFHARATRHFAKELGGAGGTVPPPAPGSTARPVAPSVQKDSIGPSTPARGSRPPASPERPSTMMGDVIDRRYKRGTEIGAGTIGTVYRGEHVTLGRSMAIKEVRSIFQFASYLRRDEIVRRLRTTIESHATLLHPGIIQIIDQNPEREYPYFVMEYASGGNLRQRLNAEKESRLDLDFAIRVLMQISYALQFAHERDVLHLSLKPENVLFDHMGNVKLTDFGFSRITERNDDSSQTPVLVGGGTVGYMAPERLQPTISGSETLTRAADIYGLGMLFYEMITGKLPGRRSPLPSQVRKDVPSAFDDVFDKMTHDELEERYSSVDDVLDGLYKAFPSKEVFGSGTILLWAKDPSPPPEPEPVVEEKKEDSAPPTPVEVPTEMAVKQSDETEIITGELDAQPVQSTIAPPRRKRPPPPPQK